jgi:alpha-galactosidase
MQQRRTYLRRERSRSWTHFSLWAIMAAPLMAGNDIANMDGRVKGLLLNKAVIAIDQDPLGIQGHRVRRDGDLEV